MQKSLGPISPPPIKFSQVPQTFIPMPTPLRKTLNKCSFMSAVISRSDDKLKFFGRLFKPRVLLNAFSTMQQLPCFFGGVLDPCLAHVCNRHCILIGNVSRGMKLSQRSKSNQFVNISLKKLCNLV